MSYKINRKIQNEYLVMHIFAKILNINNYDPNGILKPEKAKLPFIGKDGKPYPTLEDVRVADALFDEMKNPKIDVDPKMYNGYYDDIQKKGR